MTFAKNATSSVLGCTTIYFQVDHPVKPHQFEHYGSVHQLENSHIQGCHFCALIWSSIVDNGPEHEGSCHARCKEGSLLKLFRRKGNAVTVIARKTNEFSGPPKISIGIRVEGHRKGYLSNSQFGMEMVSWPGKPGKRFPTFELILR
jgi:hypothetical protein